MSSSTVATTLSIADGKRILAPETPEIAVTLRANVLVRPKVTLPTSDPARKILPKALRKPAASA
jgi:hypothetical protein